MFVARRSEPRRTPASIARFPARWGKLFPREGLMLGTASRPPSPRQGQPDTPPSPPPAAGRAAPSALVQEPSGGQGRGQPGRAAVEGSSAPRPADCRPPQPPHREAQNPATRGSSSPPDPRPPRNLFCLHGRAPRGSHPRRHREGAGRLPGGCRGAPSRRAAAGRAAAGTASAATFTAPSRGERCAGWRRGADGEQ